jgi:putative sigma-54 modulation protein
METDKVVKDYVKAKAKRLQKYVENPKEIHIVLSAEKFRHIAEVTLLGEGVTLNSQGRDSDLYAAIDQMIGKMERQIRERREKVKHKRSNPSSSKRPLQAMGPLPEDREDLQHSPIVQRRYPLAKPMSLEEAVAQLDLSKEDFLVFINSESGQMNALYRGKGGGIEWVEPHPQ